MLINDDHENIMHCVGMFFYRKEGIRKKISQQQKVNKDREVEKRNEMDLGGQLTPPPHTPVETSPTCIKLQLIHIFGFCQYSAVDKIIFVHVQHSVTGL